MSSLETMASAWMSHAARMVWVFTLAVALVLVLRRFLRRACGVEAVPLLWSLVPLALAAVQVPRSAARANALPPVVVRIAGGGSWAPPTNATGWTIPWPLLATTAWLAGTIVVLVLIGVAQRRYVRRLSGARAIDIAGVDCPIWQATQSNLGPAVVGALGVRIVLPADFHARYTPPEQALILAHEQAHARRRDGLWRLVAQSLVALFWFHPLAWYALACLCQDQELACDATVLREHGAPRREYANAMLKTQSSPLLLPVGCSWTTRHPLTERVAMLKLPVLTPVRRLAGRTALGAIVLAGSFAVYAAQPSPATYHPSAAAVDEALVLFDGAKTAVAYYWFHHDYKLPANNAAAQLPDASLIAGKYVDGVMFADGRLAATLRDSAGGGHVLLLAMPDAEHKAMRWRCESPDVPDITRLHEDCAYVPSGASGDASGNANFMLELAVSVAGQPPHLHATSCLKGTNDTYHFVSGADKTLPPWKVRLAVFPGPDGQVEVHAKLSGGSLDTPVTPIARMKDGQKAVIQIGQVVAGVDHTLRLDLAAWPGCGSPGPAADDGNVHGRFAGSARAVVQGIAQRAGMTIGNPESLDDTQPIKGNFEGVPPAVALWVIGNTLDMKTIVNGKTVRFVPK